MKIYIRHIIYEYAKNCYYGLPIEAKLLHELMCMCISICNELSNIFPKQGLQFWVLGTVHVINYHIMAYTNLPPV